MIPRREFLKNAAIGALAARLASGAELGARNAELRASGAVYEGEYPGWPWIDRDAAGTLYCVFREGTQHMYSATGRVLLCRSTDAGRTWSEPSVVADAPHIDDRNTAITVLPGGALLVVYNTYTAIDESQAMTTRSPDCGATWSPPQPLDKSNTRTRASVKVLRDGTYLLPYYIAPGNGALAGLSEDGGATWRTVRVPDADGFVGDEWDALEHAPGRLVGVFRNSHPQTDGVFWVSLSNDSGRTWSTPRRTNVRSERYPSPAQIVLHAGTPTLIYCDQRMVSVSAVRTADPAFLEWDLEHRVPCFQHNADSSPILDGGYPASVALNAHERLIVDYEIREDRKQIAWYVVALPENW